MKKQFVICDTDIVYSSRLLHQLSKRKELNCNFHACTSFESLMQWEENGAEDFLIIGESFPYEKRAASRAKKRFVLSHGKCKDIGKDEKEIYKLQGVDTMLADILGTLYDESEVDIIRNVHTRKGKLIGVYSPVRRVGQTEFALELGKFLARSEETLYLNFEFFAGISSFFSFEGSNMADLLYYFRQDGEQLARRIPALVKHMGVLDYITPFSVCADLMDVRQEEWLSLLNRLVSESVYYNIILDLGDNVQGLFEVLRYCTKIYTLHLPDEHSRWKLEQYENNLHTLQYEDILEKTVKANAAEKREVLVRKYCKD